MEKMIPILLIMSLLTAFNPVSVDRNQGQLYVVDVSAIEITNAGSERYVSDAGISLIDLTSGKELKPSQCTSRGNSYAFFAESKEANYCVEVDNTRYQIVNERGIDLKKADKYTWKVIYLKKSS